MQETPSWLADDTAGSPDVGVDAVAPAGPAMAMASTPKSDMIDEDGNIIEQQDTSSDNNKKKKGGGMFSKSKKSSSGGGGGGGGGDKSAAGTMLDASPQGGGGTTTTTTGAAQSDAEEGLPRIILLMRLANLGIAGALIAISIVVMVNLPEISTWVLAIYATCGGILVCCLETQLKFVRVAIALNFGFLFSAPLRFMFYLLLAGIAWTYGRIFGPVVAIAIAATAFFNTYILCRYPSYRRVREKIAEEEDKRIEAKISGEVKKQTINSAVSSFGR